MPDICDRLREAREGLGLSQQALAERCGVTARSQRNYESGERLPDAAYLATLVLAGVDVPYVLTGQRATGTAPDPAEQVLLDSYRRCKPAAKAKLIQTAALLSAGLDTAAPKRATRSTSGVQVGNQTSTHDGAVQIGYAGGNVRVDKK